MREQKIYPPLQALKVMEKELLSSESQTDKQYFKRAMNAKVYDMIFPSDSSNVIFISTLSSWGKVKESFLIDRELHDQFDALTKEFVSNFGDYSKIAPVPLNHLPYQSLVIDFERPIKTLVSDYPQKEEEVNGVVIKVYPNFSNKIYFVAYVLLYDEGNEAIPMFIPIPKHQDMQVQELLREVVDCAQGNKESFSTEDNIQVLNYIRRYGNLAHLSNFLTNVLTYLCAKNAEIEESERETGKPRRDISPKHNYNEVRKWNVGRNYGNAIREFRKKSLSSGNKKSGTTQSDRKLQPHMRRAHWHRFRCGKGKQDITIHWIDPILINGKDSNDLKVTKRKVK